MNQMSFTWGSNLSCEKEAFTFHKHFVFSMNERKEKMKLFQGHEKLCQTLVQLFGIAKRHNEHLLNISRFFWFLFHDWTIFFLHPHFMNSTLNRSEINETNYLILWGRKGTFCLIVKHKRGFFGFTLSWVCCMISLTFTLLPQPHLNWSDANKYSSVSSKNENQSRTWWFSCELQQTAAAPNASIFKVQRAMRERNAVRSRDGLKIKIFFNTFQLRDYRLFSIFAANIFAFQPPEGAEE